MSFPPHISLSTIDHSLLILAGTAIGVLAGAVPGLSGAMVIALAVPLTFAMQAEPALALLVSIYVGAVGGGLLTATLLRMPGTPAAIMTTLDGFPMAQRGEPRRALGLGIGASLIGGLLAGVALLLIARPAAAFSTLLGPWEMFALVLMALVLIAVISKGDLPRGLLAGCLGILLAMPGQNPATGEVRLTFGLPELADGFKVLPVLIGLFALAQVLRDAATTLSDSSGAKPTRIDASGGRLPGLSTWLRQLPNLIRSSLLGTGIGILPGVGANVGSVVAYAAAKSTAQDREEFGSGAESAIVASESANNATVGGALVPLVALGVPGSVVDAVLLGAFVIHGLQPGPLLFENNPEIVRTITHSYLLANVAMAAVMALAARPITRLATLNKAYLLPVILVCCVLGSFALANRIFDVWTMLAFGALGLLLERLRVPLAPLVIGFVLAPVAESNLLAGLMSSGNSLTPLFTRPLALLFTLVAIAMLAFSLLRGRKPSQD